MKSMHEAAIINAIMIENRSVKFYRAMSAKVKDMRSKQILERLAQEELEHLELFCNLYPGNEDELYNALVQNNIYSDPFYNALISSVDEHATEAETLRIALKEEQECIEKYSVFVETIRDPGINTVFARILDETNKHCELITEEYMRLMGMVDMSDQNIYVRE